MSKQCDKAADDLSLDKMGLVLFFSPICPKCIVDKTVCMLSPPKKCLLRSGDVFKTLVKQRGQFRISSANMKEVSRLIINSVAGNTSFQFQKD